MKRIVLVYPPFCTPASPPYSLTAIYAFLKQNDNLNDYRIADLNCLFHSKEFKRFLDYYKDLGTGYTKEEYDMITSEFMASSKETYSAINRSIREQNTPTSVYDLLSELEGADIAAFSVVYSSQVFCCYALISELKRRGIKTVVGGPAVNQKLSKHADVHLANELELLNYIKETSADHDLLDYKSDLDYSPYLLNDYFVPGPVIPFRTSNTCSYQKCTFCTHHGNMAYYEYDLGCLKRSIEKAKKIDKIGHVFIVDDMLSKERLFAVADIMKECGVFWMCQLRPTKDLDRAALRRLYESGLRVIIWGVESASTRVLKLMRKGTVKKTIQTVLQDSHDAGIANVCYIMFGFPTETREEALQTIEFLKEHADYVDLVSTSVFGLQKGSYIYEHPKEFKIYKITEKERTLLDAKVGYEVSEGMSHAEALEFRKNHKRTIEKLNKYPKTMNLFREHMLFLASRS